MLAIISEISNVTQFWCLIEVLIFKFFSQVEQLCISGSTSSYIIFKGGEQWSLSGTSPSRTHYCITVSTVPSSMGYQVDQGMAINFSTRLECPSSLYVHIVVIAGSSTKVLLAFFLLYLPSAWSIFFSNKMDDADTLGPMLCIFYARNGQSQNLHNRTESVHVQHQDVSAHHQTHIGWVKGQSVKKRTRLYCVQ